ncbi:MAG: hypothetical protein ABI333_11295 [bacterium]
MIRWTSTIALLLALGWPTTAQAESSKQTVGTQLATLNRAFNALNQRILERASLLKRMQRYQATIRQTREQKAGPARDYKLRRLLAEARALAKSLSGTDAQLLRAQQVLERARSALLRTLSRLKQAQQERIRKALAKTSSKDGRKPTVLRVAKTRIDPLDGPQEINEKADLLKDSEEKIRKRLAEVDQVIGRLQKRGKLRRIAQGVDRYQGLFGEDASRRKLTRIRPSKAPADAAGEWSNDHDGSYQPAPGSITDDGLGGSSRGSTSSTYAVVFKDLLTPATLDALRKAGQSSDPRVRLQALQRVREELKRAAAKLKARAQRYRQRAKTLRQREIRRKR